MTTWDDPETARQVVDRARRQARVDALNDIDRLRGATVDNGRDQAERLIRSSLRRPGSQTVRRNPAGGLLRDWYTTVYTAELTAGLGGEVAVPGAAEVEESAALLHRRAPRQEASHAF